MKEQDIKLLWGRAAERCSFPGCGTKLSNDKERSTESFPLGEQAHIVGPKPSSPRSDSNLTPEERESYYNRILLCPNHHTLIDKDPEEYTIEKLHLFKDKHEDWVEHTLSATKDSMETATSVIYTDLIDATVEACQFDNWDNWASRAISTNMTWDEAAHQRLFEFYNKMLGAIWPKSLPELECALKRLTHEIYEAISKFVEHCEPDKHHEGILVEDRFYKSRGWIEDHNRYQELLREYETWQHECNRHLIEATKAANWVAEVVRQNINPLFFATKGKFFLIMGPYDMLEFRSFYFEYTEQQKARMLQQCERGWSLGKIFRQR